MNNYTKKACLRMKVSLHFKGYFPELAFMQGEEFSGIYIVYSGAAGEGNKCWLRKILYIGESDNIIEDIKKPECADDWYLELNPGEQLYFTVAEVEKSTRQTARGILINLHKPPCNEKFASSIPEEYQSFHVSYSGATKLLQEQFCNNVEI